MARIFLLSLVFVIFSCTQKEASTPSQTLNEVIAADNAGDLEKVIAHYADDAILIPSGSNDIVGKNAIREHYRNIFANSSMQLQSTANEIIDVRELTIMRGITTGKSISKTDSSSTAVNDKFLMILKKESGSWKVYRLMWSKNQ